jgi:hypothetical protein
VGARCRGEKAAAEAIHWLCASGILEDTGEVKKPRRDQSRMAAREKFGRGEHALVVDPEHVGSSGILEG